MVEFIVSLIVLLQIIIFASTFKKMRLFGNIFREEESWALSVSEDNKVMGINGQGNKIFLSIRQSINKYLGNNVGGVIDFSLLKDSTDRHCDSVENDITSMMPVPLYLGLVGTMAGVITGLVGMLQTDAITSMMTSSGEVVDAASNLASQGINELLSGVALAMVASICGILLTTINTLLFKRYKRHEDEGKNSFMAWLQATLIPNVSTNITDSLETTVTRMNATFTQNVAKLSEILGSLDQFFSQQAEMVAQLHQMDIVKTAKVNIAVLQELQRCCDTFEVLCDVSRTAADADRTLQEALTEIKESSADYARQINNGILEQNNQLHEILNEERQTFQTFANEVSILFQDQIQRAPGIEKQLAEISKIPASIDRLLKGVESSNRALADSVIRALEKTGGSKTVPSSANAVKKKDEANPEIVEETDDKHSTTKAKWIIAGVSIALLVGFVIFVLFRY